MVFSAPSVCRRQVIAMLWSSPAGSWLLPPTSVVSAISGLPDCSTALSAGAHSLQRCKPISGVTTARCRMPTSKATAASRSSGQSDSDRSTGDPLRNADGQIDDCVRWAAPASRLGFDFATYTAKPVGHPALVIRWVAIVLKSAAAVLVLSVRRLHDDEPGAAGRVGGGRPGLPSPTVDPAPPVRPDHDMRPRNDQDEPSKVCR